jgi:DNA-binding response OmpR family regulator
MQICAAGDDFDLFFGQADFLRDTKRHAAIDDILIASDTCTITLGTKEMTLGPALWTIFNMLLLNAGHVVSKDQLSEQLRVPANLSSYIHNLRVKLGVQAQKRIQSVEGVGYIYVSPVRNTA